MDFKLIAEILEILLGISPEKPGVDFLSNEHIPSGCRKLIAGTLVLRYEHLLRTSYAMNITYVKCIREMHT